MVSTSSAACSHGAMLHFVLVEPLLSNFTKHVLKPLLMRRFKLALLTFASFMTLLAVHESSLVEKPNPTKSPHRYRIQQGSHDKKGREDDAVHTHW